MATINLNDEEDTANPEFNPTGSITLIDEGTSPKLDANSQRERAAMADYALQDKSPGLENIHQALKEGQETVLRQQASINEGLKRQQMALRVAMQTAAAKDGPVSAEDQETLQALMNTNYDPSPEAVWEEMWANNYTKEVVMDPYNKTLEEGMKRLPENTLAKVGSTDTFVAKTKFAESILQEFKKRYEDELSWLGGTNERNPVNKTQAWFTTIFPMANQAIQYFAGDGTSLLQGKNLTQQVEQDLYLPQDKFYTTVREKAEAYWKINPHVAMSYLEALHQRPSSAEAMENFFGVFEAVTLVPAAKLARGAKATADGLSKSIKAEPVAVSAQYAKDMENIVFTPEQVKNMLKGAEVEIGKAVATDKKARTVFIPHGIAPEALEKAQDAFSGLPSTHRSWFNERSSAASLEAPRGILEEQGPVIKYTTGKDILGNKTFNVNSDTVFITKDEATKLGYNLEGLPETQKRIFRNKDGELELSERINGRWTRTGEKITPTSDPKAGDIALSLGPHRSSMGSRYYDNYRQEEISGITRSVGRESTEVKMGLTPDEAQKAMSSFTRRSPFSEGTLQDAGDAVNSFLSSMVRSVATAPKGLANVGKTDAQGALTTLGRVEDAANIGAVNRILLQQGGFDYNQEMEEAGKMMLSLFRNPFLESASNNSRELAGRKADMLEKSAEVSNRLIASLSDPRVNRSTQEDLAKAAQLTKARLEKQFTHMDDGIIDISYADDLVYVPQNNVYYQVVTFGQPNATPFKTWESARNTFEQLYRIPSTDYTIAQQGDGYVVKYARAVTTDDPLGKTMTIGTGNETPKHWVNALLGGLRSAEDTTSEFQRSARHAATHYPQNLKAVIQEAVDSTPRLTRTERAEVKMLIDEDRYRWGEDGNQGAWFKDVGEFEQAFVNRFGKRPSDAAIANYDMYVKLHEYDEMIRILSLHGHMERKGVQNVTFKTWVNGEERNTNTFAGMVVEDWDHSLLSKTDLPFYYVDDVNKTGKMHWTSDFKNNIGGLKDDIDAKLKDGSYKLIRLYQPLRRPLGEVLENNSEIYYVVTNTAQTSKVKLGQYFDRRLGPHHEYQWSNYIKQVQVGVDDKGQTMHLRDATILSGGPTELGSKKLAGYMEEARKLMNAGDDAALDAHLRAKLPWDIDAWKAKFTGPNALDPNMPIVHVRNGEDSFTTNPDLYDIFSRDLKINLNKDTMKSYADAGLNPEAGMSRAFFQERADQALEEVTSQGLVRAKQVDPFHTINRSLGQAIRARYMDDYKQLGAESFVTEFGKFIESAPSTEAMLRNPYYYVYNAKPKTGTPPAERAAFLAQQRNMQNFLGMKSDTQKFLDHVQMKAENMIYSTLGEKKAADILNSPFITGALIPTIKDPFRFMRSVAFHAQIGLGNPIQMFVQSQAWFHVMAIAPSSGMRGASAATLINTGGRYAEEAAVFDKYADMASKFGGWKKEDFVEAVDAWKKSGISHVAGETAWRNDFFDPKFYESGVGKFLDKAAFFFTKTERYIRDTAYFTAFHEWRKANPGKKFDQFAEGEVMNRFDTLSLSMTRASNSSLQEGVYSIPTQFLTFNQRQMEEFFSKRLNKYERYRLMGTYSALYGVPVGLSSATLFGYVPGLDTISGGAIPNPNYEDIKKWSIEKGINMDDKAVKLFHDGLLDTIFTLATGKDTNINKRYGPGAADVGRDFIAAFTGDVTGASQKTAGEILVGASGQIGMDIAKSLFPFFRSALGTFSDDQQFPLTGNDFLNVGRFVATFNGAERLAYAASVGKYYTRRGNLVGDVDTFDGFLMAFMGLTPQKFEDAYLKQNIVKAHRTMQEKVGYEMQKEYGRAIEEANKGNWDSFQTHMVRAKTLGKGADMRLEQYGENMVKSARGKESLVDRVNQQWMFYQPKNFMKDRQIQNMNNKLEGAQ